MMGGGVKLDTRNTELFHYGVKGMKWGIRRYQRKDGSLTNAGKKRLAISVQKSAKGKTRSDVHSTLKSESHIQSAIKATRKLHHEYSALSDKAEKDYDAAYQIAHEKAKRYIDKHWNEGTHPDYAEKKEGNRYYDTWIEGLEDHFYQESSASASMKAADAAWDRYQNQLTSTVDSLVGKYGNRKVSVLNEIYGTTDQTTVRNLVTNTITSENFNDYYRRFK